MEKLIISRPILVEGKYDKITLSSVLSAHIISLDGFGIFHAHEKTALLRRLAEKCGLIVLTDPDGGGKQIRAYLSQILPPERLTHLYIPAIAGKERRKTKSGKAGLLGVEGMEPDTLRRLFAPFADGAPPKDTGGITKQDFYSDGLSGKRDAKERREALARAFALPPNMTANALLSALNLLYTKEEYKAALAANLASPEDLL